MINSEILYRLFECKEGFELPDKIIDLYINNRRKLENIANELSKGIDLNDKDSDLFLEYFQTEHSDRKALKQDYTPGEISKLIYKLVKRDGLVLDLCAGTGSLSIPWLVDGNSKERIMEFREYSKRATAFLLLNLIIRKANATVRQMDVLIDELKAPPKSKADYAFIIRGLENLSDDGVMVMVLPHGVLFRGNAEGEIRKWLLEKGYIEAVTGLPDSMFQNTGIPVCLVIFRKNRNDKNVLFIDASREFVKINKFNKLEEKHIDKIDSVYKNKFEVEKYSHIASYEEIKKNDFNLNIPRYVDTSEKEECEPLDVAMADLLAIQTDIVKTQGEFISMMKELTGNSDEVQRELNKAVEFLNDSQKVEVNMLESIVKEFSKC